METKKLRVLVTAGGTKVRIDDVRHVGNFSRGKFGYSIARRFADYGAEVTLLASHELLERIEPPEERRGPALRYASYVYYEDFRDQLFRIIEEERLDVVIMAAAVSDWLCTDARSGKIESNKERMTLEFVRAPKLIAELRDRAGREAFVVGFKLLSGASREQLLEKARAQLRTCRLNLVVANDLSHIKDGRHSVDIVTPEGGATHVDGTHKEAVDAIVEHVRRRQNVRWSRSVKSPACPLPIPLSECYRDAGTLLELARRASLFGGTDGNVSVRRSLLGDFVITPRQVQKREVFIDDLLQVDYDPLLRVVEYSGEKKPSIDSVVHATLYARFPSVEALLHVHPDAGIFVPDAVTAKAYPCGTVEEADVITDAARKLPNGARFCIELVDHGYLIALERGGAERLLQQWGEAGAAYRAHLAEVGQSDKLSGLVLRPVFAFADIVGVHATMTGDGCVSVFLLPEKRGHGLGERVMDALDRRGDMVIANDKCAVTDYYVSHGWKVIKREDGFAHLLPPSKRIDLRIAATLCLVDESTGRVLLGKRLTKEWHGMYSFPGGCEEPVDGGRLWKTAWREAKEELGIEFPSGVFVRHHELTTCVGTGLDGDYACRVTAHVVILPTLPSFGSSEEMDGHAHGLATAAAELPMSRGTKRVLREAQKLLKAHRAKR